MIHFSRNGTSQSFRFRVPNYISVVAEQGPSKEKKKQRMDSYSSSESDIGSFEMSDGSKNEQLPVRARDLPRPHKSLSPRSHSKGQEQKPRALENHHGRVLYRECTNPTASSHFLQSYRNAQRTHRIPSKLGPMKSNYAK